MAYWLVKTEPEVYSIDDLERERSTLWTDVRNYQARNYLREMQKGDDVLVYHSNANPSGVAGLARVRRVAVADPSQFDPKSESFDPKANLAAPRWFSPELEFISKGKHLIPLNELREVAGLKKMELLRKGSRLSVQPVTIDEFRVIRKLLNPS